MFKSTVKTHPTLDLGAAYHKERESQFYSLKKEKRR